MTHKLTVTLADQTIEYRWYTAIRICEKITQDAICAVCTLRTGPRDWMLNEKKNLTWKEKKAIHGLGNPFGIFAFLLNKIRLI